MKHILKFIITIIIVLPAFATKAQNKKDGPEKDGYVKMEKGQVIEYKNGVWGYLMDTYVCSNGEKIATDGTVTKPDGSTAKLNNGDKIYEDGHMAGNSSKTQSTTATSGKAKHTAAGKQ